ncbi:MAG: hypothetical protein NWQ55_10780 [Salibacteraceae bacterium]|jgi:hypothetical protein|nr:hypothetical protein [Salibacteraceae bacterium]MDP4687249.1 hypothetical protein [Salibacteraceae bacterium]MDP4844201.1 hypothetical protein [Salibacteraceae bacterium]MDP4965551.1 hypothetical protein [Salibacteraceae bacterium]
MQKKLPYLVFSALMVIGLFSFTLSVNPKPTTENNTEESYSKSLQQDYSDCITKVDSKWGGQCMNYGFSESKYTVNLVNTCNEKLDLMCAVQRDNERWRLFYRMDMNPKDTLSAYACRGNGKYLKWVRKAGDVTVKFPTLDQVNEQY